MVLIIQPFAFYSELNTEWKAWVTEARLLLAVNQDSSINFNEVTGHLYHLTFVILWCSILWGNLGQEVHFFVRHLCVCNDFQNKWIIWGSKCTTRIQSYNGLQKRRQNKDMLGSSRLTEQMVNARTWCFCFHRIKRFFRHFLLFSGNDVGPAAWALQHLAQAVSCIFIDPYNLWVPVFTDLYCHRRNQWWSFCLAFFLKPPPSKPESFLLWDTLKWTTYPPVCLFTTMRTSSHLWCYSIPMATAALAYFGKSF